MESKLAGQGVFLGEHSLMVSCEFSHLKQIWIQIPIKLIRGFVDEKKNPRVLKLTRIDGEILPNATKS